MALKYTGLTSAQVEESRRINGINILTPPKKTPLWRQFLEKFKDPLIMVLLVAGALSIGISIYEYYCLDESGAVFFEPLGIFIAILLATGLGFIFEVKAEREFAILNQVNDDEPVEVIRDGGAIRIPKKDVVVGDIVILSAGEEIPADGHLLEATSLMVDESILTGEPACSKSTDPSHFDDDATFPTDAVMKGTKVMEGHGVFEVTAVGDSTENGKVYEAASIDDSIKTPLSIQLDKLGKLITKLSYTVGVLILVGRCVMYFVEGTPFDTMKFLAYFLQSIMIAVTLVVVSVPEGLPMAVTLSLAYSMRRMLRTNNLVRKMHACETMGATTVICTDKTGTLTENQMRLAETDFCGLDGQMLADNDLSRIIQEGIAVNSTAMLDLSNPQRPQVLGNPTEGALILWLKSQGVDYAELRGSVNRIAEIPFSTERKYMATEVESALLPGKKVVYVKGAPEIVLEMCASINGGVSKTAVNEKLSAYQSQAMRTLGFAYQIVDEDKVMIDGLKLRADNLVFIGAVAISDPVRKEVPAAIKECIDAGITIKVVTGDTPATAREIARNIGLWTDRDNDRNMITGPEFAELSDDELYERVGDLKIIARARPLDKKRLVEALQHNGEVVAVTGDGTNDAPALKTAHVGLSMGDGTSVAKEASDITIVDNSFASIGKAVMWGRSLYKNIQRFILFQLTVNVVASLIVLIGAFTGTESPLTVTQMLWVNLIMDTFAAMALASLPPSAAVMRDKPRSRNAFIITGSMKRNILSVGALFTAVLLGVLYVFHHSHVENLTYFFSEAGHLSGYHGLSVYELSLFFTIFVFLQFWNMFNARAFDTGRSAFHLAGCSEFLMIAGAIFIGQILIVEFGGNMLNVTPINLIDWIIIIGATSIVLWFGEIFRLFKDLCR
ncbi:MAG: calcium-translocating P-type ATPase, PMCA-type [Bacteroides sp.]|nr:calcium-translocating P-type ATPase, PMCA-type [Bacteroides sp.]MCM1389555.1 calcium-translocating P-type ATPase, PMCA-type [Bacteroides sp.]